MIHVLFSFSRLVNGSQKTQNKIYMSTTIDHQSEEEEEEEDAKKKRKATLSSFYKNVDMR